MQSVTTGSVLPIAEAAVGSSAGLAAVSLAAAAVQLIVAVGVYVWGSLALAAVFRKVGRPPGRAWVPVWNLWQLFELAGMKGWWAAVLVGGGILTAILSSVTASLIVQSAQGAAFGAGGDASGALLAATVVPMLFFIAFAAAAIVIMLRMMGPLNRGFGRSGGFAVLGALLLPVWASIIGWGSATWLGIPRGGIPPTPFAASPAPAAAAAPADTTAFAPPPTAAPSPAAPTPVALALQPGAPVPTNPWSPPPLAPVSAPVATAAAPAVEGTGAPETEVDEHTVLAAHRRPSAALMLPTGQTVALTAAVVVLGRNPAVPGDEPGAQAVAIDDATRTVSKTHALLRRTDDGWSITDLSSTNGVIVGDSESEIPVGTPVSVRGRFLLGDAELTLDAGGR
ncbi:DUF5684 domain-containing protein [Microbacterium sp. NPDC091382]|uniref:DUF5684 domain-containing protein n=1 Tax=Microbacterium sp. NPDC091382 TaxID=3364210 RepID=UPI0038284560